MQEKLNQGENEVILHQNTARLRGSLTPLQSRSMLAILKRANDEVGISKDINVFSIPTKTFISDIQYKDNSSHKTTVEKLETHLRVLMTKTFEWGTDKERNICVFIQQIKITEKEVTFIFSDYIRKHIRPISNALIVRDFELIQSFRSEYSRQLYKHLMMWEKKGSLFLSIEDFKDFLGVPNTPSYERMDNLRTKVLNVAINEINEKKPSLNLQAVSRKEGKRIVGFNFGWYYITQKEIKNSLFTKEELKSEFDEYIGKFIDTDKKILSIRKFDIDKINVSTPVGDYKFPNIERLRREVKEHN